ncbi:MAG: hypothetical protein GX913_09290 [Clostridiales bacterium]|nr:hypothetical protein [Clostridiales bacterium]
MKKYESKRNGQIAELVSQTEEQVTMRFEDGEEKSFSPATLKRWWVEIEEPQANEEQIAETVKELVQEEQSLRTEIPSLAEEIMEEEQEESTNEVEEKPAEVKKEVKKRNIEPHSLKGFIEEEARKRNCILFSGKVKALVSIKLENGTAMAFTFSGKGVNLWVKSINCEGITDDYKKTKHLFDARIAMREDTPEARELIIKLLEKSIETQKNKNTK